MAWLISSEWAACGKQNVASNCADYEGATLTGVTLPYSEIQDLAFFLRRSVCTEAGMYAIRARRKSASEKDFLDSVNKVIKGYKKFSSTSRYMHFN